MTEYLNKYGKKTESQEEAVQPSFEYEILTKSILDTFLKPVMPNDLFKQRNSGDSDNEDDQKEMIT